MSKALNHSSQFYPGRVIYHVYGVAHPKGSTLDDDEVGYSKSYVLSKPYSKNLGIGGHKMISWCFNLETFLSHDVARHAERLSFVTTNFLADAGVFDLDADRSTPYNLNRFFGSAPDAKDFIKELQTGVFSDPVDQKQFDSSCAYKEEHSWFFEDPYYPEDDYGDDDGWTGENEGKHS